MRKYYILDSVIVGNVIESERIKQGKTKEVISGLADIHRNHLHNIEYGKNRPTLDTFCKIADALGLKPSALLEKIERETENLRR